MTHVKTPHKHAEMMKAYADDTSLCAFVKFKNQNKWHDTSRPFFDDKSCYFLCLQKHKEACFHWMNGGEVEFFEHDKWHTINSKIKWASGHLFMGEMFKTRIKPRKEIRHIYISTLGATTYAKKTKEEAAREVSIMGGSFDVWKHYEIEIEVEV